MGNVGDKLKHFEGRKRVQRITPEMKKTIRLAKRFPKANFVGISIKGTSRQLPENVRQIRGLIQKRA